MAFNSNGVHATVFCEDGFWGQAGRFAGKGESMAEHTHCFPDDDEDGGGGEEVE